MILRRILLSLIPLSLAFASTLAFAQVDAQEEEPAAVGEVTRIQGTAFVRNARNFGVLSPNSPLAAGDRIITGRGSRVELTLQDGSVITLGGTTDFTVSDYAFKPRDDIGTAVFKLARGAFRAVTGRISSVSRPDFRVQTPVATAGVRGTDFWGGLRFFDDHLHVALLGGSGVFVESGGRTVDIEQVGYGVTARKDQAPSEPAVWDTEKMTKAAASVTWD
ncbi:MAG: FecR family protein [Gammaproteobacteria bacterium]